MKKQTKDQLFKRMAYLEFVQDQLSSELTYLDSLLRAVGFPQGLSSVKDVAKDIIQDNSKE